MDPNQQKREAEISRRRILQLGAAGAIALPTLSALLAACGGDDDDGGDRPSPSGGAATATTLARDLAVRPRSSSWPEIRGEYYDPIRSVAVEYVQLNCIFDTLLGLSRVNSTIRRAWPPNGPRRVTAYGSSSATESYSKTERRSMQTQSSSAWSASSMTQHRTRKARLANVASIEVVDPATVEIVMKTAAPGPLLIQLTDRPGMIVSPTAVKAVRVERSVLQEARRRGHVQARRRLAARAESMSVRRWDGYWDKEAYC